MRILHLDCGRQMRGGQWQALRLHRGLIAAGHKSLLLARGAPLRDIAHQWELPCAEIQPWKLLFQSARFDIVHAHDARSHTLAALLSRAPVMVSRRVAFPVKTGALSRWKYARPALFLAVSRYVAEQLRIAGVENQRVQVVYDGVPVPAAPASGDVVLVPFSDDPGKGMALAESAAARAGVSLQRSSDLEADLPHARALVYLSQSEGLGSGILLAMAYGVPVIASNVGGIPELIQNGVNGVLVRNAPDEIAAAFGCVNRPMGAAARQTVLERFSEARMVRETLAAYAGILGHV